MLTFLFTFILSTFASTNAPVTNEELRNFAVMIVNSEMSSGGTGSILRSSNNGSLILTNRHVCEVVQHGGYIIKDRLRVKVVSYQEYDKHDLCLIKVKLNLGVNIKVATVEPKMAEASAVSGFPRLYPNTITRGHFSDKLIVRVMVGEEECTEEEYLTNVMCMFFGIKPIVKPFKAQHTSNLIQPGNSGSAVLNSKGELAGVVFAGSGDLGWALIVPHEFVVDFIKNRKQYPSIKPEKDLFMLDKEAQDNMDSLEKFNLMCKLTLFKPKQIKELCQNLYFDRLHRKGN